MDTESLGFEYEKIPFNDYEYFQMEKDLTCVILRFNQSLQRKTSSLLAILLAIGDLFSTRMKAW